MLDSKATASIKQAPNGVYLLYIRENYIENLDIYSFRKHLKQFKTEHDALMYFKKTYPMGVIVPFDDLPKR